ncbi:unnamed protein product [Mytilus coruscus]|uniref:Fibronectin type-III domain-containing protein n=1 Tax=Mytilus coruscus TaxID=42192 RepID=A0A6J8CAW0_MYTCO|nr:unnamed protein product [Mytilus coruscus]
MLFIIFDFRFQLDLVIRHKDVEMNWFKTVQQILIFCAIVVSLVVLVVSQKCQKSQYLHRAPNGFSILENDDCSITVEWCRDNSTDIQEYEFLHRRQGTVDWAVSTISIDNVVEQINGRLMYKLKNLLPETNYEMKICSVSNHNKSQYTESKTPQTQKNDYIRALLNQSSYTTDFLISPSFNQSLYTTVYSDLFYKSDLRLPEEFIKLVFTTDYIRALSNQSSYTPDYLILHSFNKFSYTTGCLRSPLLNQSSYTTDYLRSPLLKQSAYTDYLRSPLLNQSTFTTD